MSDISQLAKHVGRITKVVVAETDRLKREVATEILRTVVLFTPVDTSLHLSNWQVGIGFSPSGPIPAHKSGSGGSTAGSSAEIAIAIGSGHLAASARGQTIFISNSAPVIVELNTGGVVSDKDGGFVEKAIDKGEDIVRKFKFKSI